MSVKDKWVFKSGKSIFIRCWNCEDNFDIRAVHREDGFCPNCNNIEIDLSDDPYEKILAELEKTND
jgi:Zn finger protein HypA/HybF involved in hydrogenase expression